MWKEKRKERSDGKVESQRKEKGRDREVPVINFSVGYCGGIPAIHKAMYFAGYINTALQSNEKSVNNKSEVHQSKSKVCVTVL